jgi:hypothetical protein
LVVITAAAVGRISAGLVGWRLSLRAGIVSAVFFGTVSFGLAWLGLSSPYWAAHVALISAAWFGVFGAITATVAQWANRGGAPNKLVPRGPNPRERGFGPVNSDR